MSKFHMAVQDIAGQHLDSQCFDEISECTAFAKNAEHGDIFEIHKNSSPDFLRGIRKPNGYIDWVRTPY